MLHSAEWLRIFATVIIVNSNKYAEGIYVCFFKNDRHADTCLRRMTDLLLHCFTDT